MRRTMEDVAVVLTLLLAATNPGQAAINLELRPVHQSVSLGSQVDLGLYAASDNEAGQLLSAADVILGWEPGYLDLLGNSNAGAVLLLASGFPATDPYGLNESVPPQDGDGLYIAYAFGGQPVVATPAGTLLTTFQFQAVGLTSLTTVALLPAAGSPLGHTVVYDGTVPGLNVTGTLGSATVTIVPEPAAAVGLLLILAGGTRRRCPARAVR